MRSTYEDDLQIAVADWLDLQGWRWFHPANERKTSKAVGAKLKRKGVKRGVPDVMIFERWTDEYYDGENTFHGSGIAIELKCPHIKPGTDPRYPNGVTKTYPTPEQKQWLADLKARGWLTAVCRTINEVTTVCEAVRRDGR